MSDSESTGDCPSGAPPGSDAQASARSQRLAELPQRRRNSSFPRARRKPVALHEMGLRPATLAALVDAGIVNTYRLLEYSCRELIWHSAIRPDQVYEVLRRLDGLGMGLPPTPQAGVRVPGERNLEFLRLRVVEGRTNQEVAARMGVTIVRVRQVLAWYFGLRGVPLAARRKEGT